MRLHFRIATLFLVVAVLALDFARVRLLHPANGRSVFAFAAQGFDLGVLPMANVLAFGLYRMLSRREAAGPFLAGFEVCGLGAVVAFMAWCWAAPKSVVVLIVPLYFAWTRVRPLSPSDPSILVVGAVSFVLPQLLIATLGGWVARRLARRRDVGRSPGQDGPECVASGPENHPAVPGHETPDEVRRNSPRTVG